MKIQKTVIAVSVIIMLVISSCAKKPTLEQRLDSDDAVVVKAALTDMWRLDKAEAAIKAVGFLSAPGLRKEAAAALSFMRSEAIDKIVASRMTGVAEPEGFLLYFMSRYRDEAYGEKISSLVKTLPRPGPEKPAADFMYMILTGSWADAAEYFDKVSDLKTAQKEYIILAGNKKIGALSAFLENITDSGFRPLALWAARMIKPAYKIKYDLVDRTITSNPYWEKYGDAPVMPGVPGTFKSWHTANPDILVENGIIYFYYRGGDGHDRMAVATSPYDTFDGVKFMDYPRNPIINLGTKSFDDLAVLDPAAVYFKEQVFLYYSGLGTGDDAVGLATSKDFYNFNKRKKPVLTGRAPEVVLKDGIIYMYYVKPNEKGGYSVYLATSDDGHNFVQFGNLPVFTYNADIEWDSKSVTVPRIREKDGVYYMFYAGDDKYMDYPAYFGVAFSYDLVNWYRGTQNPVFSRGKKGDWDDGGIWYAEVFPYKDRLYMYYEGWGGAESHEQEYGPGGRSQIGLAVSEYKLEDML